MLILVSYISIYSDISAAATCPFMIRPISKSYKYFKIDASSGSAMKVNAVGDNVKKYYQSVSGSASFAKRVEHANRHN